MRDLSKFKNGIFIAFYTAYDENGNVSPERVKALAEYYYKKNVTGLYITGSSGESVYLSTEERKLVMKSVMEAVGGKLTIIAHVGAPSTRDSVELAKYAKKVGVDAISSIPPIYYGLPEDAIADYWTAMIDASGLPFIIYNIPQNTSGVSMSLFKKMLQNPNMIGIKNTSLPVQDILGFRNAGGEDIVIFNGPDEQLAAGRLMGADSGIGGTYGVMPELFLKINECINKNDFKLASEIQKATTTLIFEILSTGGLFAVCKEILRLRGMDIGKPRLPLAQLKEEDYPKVAALEKKITATIEKYCK